MPTTKHCTWQQRTWGTMVLSQQYICSEECSHRGHCWQWLGNLEMFPLHLQTLSPQTVLRDQRTVWEPHLCLWCCEQTQESADDTAKLNNLHRSVITKCLPWHVAKINGWNSLFCAGGETGNKATIITYRIPRLNGWVFNSSMLSTWTPYSI